MSDQCPGDVLEIERTFDTAGPGGGAAVTVAFWRRMSIARTVA